MNDPNNGLPADPAQHVVEWVRAHADGIRANLPLLVAVVVLVLVAACVVWLRNTNASAGQVATWSAQAQRDDGVASARVIRKVASRKAMRRKACVLRPSLRQLTRWERFRIPTTQYATPLATVGRQKIWSSIEDVTLRVGGPRTGKTGELACRILDAPGAVIATSTRTDLIKLTAVARGDLGPVYVFDPSGIADAGSTIGFDPLSGCSDIRTAAARAADLLGGSGGPGADGDREYWAAQARRVLTALLHAAALGEATMHEVQAWVADPDAAAPAVTRILRRSSATGVVADATQFLTTNHNTRSSICSSIMPALGWLSDADATAATADTSFDVEALLRDRATVYLLGAEEATVAPLLAALTGHIAREARRLAASCPDGRLDPPLTLALDEAALICPIPLDNWTADMGGRNVTIHIAVQSRAQLRQRWGDTGAAAILNNAATVLIFGGARDDDDLTAWSLLCGERLEKVLTRDERGRVSSTSTRRVPVLSPAEIANLPTGHVVIKRRGMPTAIGRVQMAWDRREVRAVQRSGEHRSVSAVLAAVTGR